MALDLCSRVSGKAKEFSDLDLAVMGEVPVGAAVLADLREAFRAWALLCVEKVLSS